MRIRSVFATLCFTTMLGGAACGKADLSTAALFASTAALSESHADGVVSWQVDPDGTVQAVVKSHAGKPIDKGITGQASWKTPDREQTVTLTVDDKSGILRGAGPRLETDLTEIRYTLLVDGKPWTGTLFVPKGGTRQLSDDMATSDSQPAPDATPGPNGGIVQVVGSETIEIVGDRTTGQIRVYILDTNLKPVPVGTRKVKLAVAVPGASEIVQLAPAANGEYFAARLATRTDPQKITVALTVNAKTEVVLVGRHRGRPVLVGAAARPLRLWVETHWDDDDEHERHEHHDDLHHHERERVDIKIKDHHHGKGKSQIKIKIH